MQVNTTDWHQFSGVAGGIVGGGMFDLQVAASNQDYYQTFSSVAAGRATERLTFAQTINTCLASRYEAPVYVVRSCIGFADDLFAGKSY